MLIMVQEVYEKLIEKGEESRGTEGYFTGISYLSIGRQCP
jgi:hypothetical protein